MVLAALNQPMAQVDSPGLSITNPQFNTIASMVQRGDYVQAAGEAETLLQAQVYDIRLISYFLYGEFLQQKIAGLDKLVCTISYLLAHNWDAIGPREKREKHTQMSFLWLFSQINKKLEHEGPQWIQPIPPAQMTHINRALDALQTAITPRLAEKSSTVLEPVDHLKYWLRALPATRSEELPLTTHHEKATELHNTPVPGAQIDFRLATGMPVTLLEASPPLAALVRKMAAFVHLAEKGEAAKAAMIAFDVNGLMEHFDPTVYFPKMFADYLRCQVTHFAEIEGYQQAQESPAWRAMAQFYEVDLMAFIKAELPQVVTLDSTQQASMEDMDGYSSHGASEEWPD